MTRVTAAIRLRSGRARSCTPTRKAAFIAVPDGLLRDLGIDLRGIKVGVAKQLLDHHNIHSGVKRAGGKSMPEFMGMQRS